VQNHAGTKKFEAKQLKEDSFREIVDHVWQQADAANLAGGIHAKLNHLHTSMHAWDHEILRKPKRLLRACSPTEIGEGRLWMQRSRANGLQNGDRNTTFFHQLESAIRKKNLIKILKHDDT
jgi:hypothetical protein